MSKGNSLLHRCPCGWARELVDDRMVQNKVFEHPVYGMITYREAAQRDVKLHSCSDYKLAKVRAQRATEYYTRKALIRD